MLTKSHQLSEKAQKLAILESKDLSSKQEKMLESPPNDAIEIEGDRLAWMHAFEEKILSCGLTGRSLVELPRFAALEKTTTEKWFTKSLSMSGFLHLQREFPDVRPDPKLAPIHLHRAEIFWIRNSVLKEATTPWKQLSWNEYLWMYASQSDLTQEELESYSRHLATRRFGRKEQKLASDSWGRSYRNFRSRRQPQ